MIYTNISNKISRLLVQRTLWLWFLPTINHNHNTSRAQGTLRFCTKLIVTVSRVVNSLLLYTINRDYFPSSGNSSVSAHD